MEFIKKHYEKIILSVVLIGLVGVLIAMWFIIMADKQSMQDFKNQYVSSKGPTIAGLDMSRQDAVLDRLKKPYALDFSVTNKLFNPVQWQRDKNGNLMKIADSRTVGPQAVIVTRIIPLYYEIKLVSTDTNGLAPVYKVTDEHQGARLKAQRAPVPHFAAKGQKIANLFTIEAVKGLPEDPTELTLKFTDGQTVTVGKDQPYRRVEGYAADLRYDPENRKFDGQRLGDHLVFANDDHNIVAINQNEVVLLAQSNQKQYVLPYRQ